MHVRKAKSFKLTLPYPATIATNKCRALACASHLLLQCTRGFIKGQDICKYHQQKGAIYGRIEERLAKSLYGYSVQVKDKLIVPLPYSHYMMKNNVSMADVEKLARTKKVNVNKEHYNGLSKQLGGEVDDEEAEAAMNNSSKKKRKYTKVNTQ